MNVQHSQRFSFQTKGRKDQGGNRMIKVHLENGD